MRQKSPTEIDSELESLAVDVESVDDCSVLLAVSSLDESVEPSSLPDEESLVDCVSADAELPDDWSEALSVLEESLELLSVSLEESVELLSESLDESAELLSASLDVSSDVLVSSLDVSSEELSVSLELLDDVEIRPPIQSSRSSVPWWGAVVSPSRTSVGVNVTP